MSVTIQLRTLVAFATGLAVALIAVFVFHAWRVDAAPGAGEATFVPIAPCRLVDTRPASQVGPRGTPLGADETHEQQVTGTNGDCTIPTSANGISLNATAVNSTAPSFMTLFPFDAARPNASNLNYSAGSLPTPNKVDVKLSADGKIGVYNLAGTVDFVADVAGYYTTAGLDNLQQQITRNRVMSARVRSDGTKSATGRYTSSRVGTGLYSVIFDVETLEIPIGTFWTSVASAVGSAHIAVVSSTLQSTNKNGKHWATVKTTISMYDSNGNQADSQFSLMLKFDDPNPLLVSF